MFDINKVDRPIGMFIFDIYENNHYLDFVVKELEKL